ncbi:DUF892 family protein [bacterium]|nr:MAG: DUF892 family protein [bacterium]
METLQGLFEESVKDIYSAEKQFLRAMPKLAKAARDESLQEAINVHIEQSSAQLDRLDLIGEMTDFKLNGKVCKVAAGLVEEAEEYMKQGKPGPILDAAIVSCIQKNEHYEIATYSALAAWAGELGMKDAVAILEEILAEEQANDNLLTSLAKGGLNKAAAAA